MCECVRVRAHWKGVCEIGVMRQLDNLSLLVFATHAHFLFYRLLHLGCINSYIKKRHMIACMNKQSDERHLSSAVSVMNCVCGCVSVRACVCLDKRSQRLRRDHKNMLSSRCQVFSWDEDVGGGGGRVRKGKWGKKKVEEAALNTQTDVQRRGF